MAIVGFGEIPSKERLFVSLSEGQCLQICTVEAGVTSARTVEPYPVAYSALGEEDGFLCLLHVLRETGTFLNKQLTSLERGCLSGA